MEFTEKMQKVMECAVRLAQEGNHRYFMPEHVVYGMTFDEDFRREYEAGGGKAKRLRQDLLEFLREQAGVAAEDQEGPQMTLDVQQVFRMATEQAESSSRDAVEVSHLLSALMRLKDSFGLYYMTVQDVDLVEVLGELSRRSLSEERGSEPLMPEEPNTYETSEDPESKNSRWKNFLENMNETCRKQNPLIGRTEELERTIQILCRKDKNNVLHIGEPGVGKTALAYGLAQKIEDGQVPEPLKQAVLYALDLGGLLAGTQYRGDFEKRFKEIIDGLEKEAQPILYLDEIHNIVGAGAVNGGSLDVANLLKPYLAAGHIRFIGATTYEEYKKHFSGQRSLVRRFQNVDIQEPTKEEAVEILKGLKPGYERFHGVRYRAGVLEHAVEVSSRYINERFLPDKAIDLIDEAGAFRKLHPQEQKIQTVNKTLIDEVLSKTCSIPAQTVEKGETEKLALLEGNIRKQIFGQDEAAAQVVNAVKFSRAGLNDEHKPVASFLFVGATGVGKTELAKVLAKELGIAFLRFDMSEYAEKHTVAKLIGAPAGYVGYEEGGILTEEIRKHPHAVLLLDEIEKAHPDIFNVLLQVMDYATLTDNQGRKADFRNIILIMTSNAGAGRVGKSRIGFGSEAVNMDALTEAVKQTFQPEFRNRLSKIVLFRTMDDRMAEKITGKKLQDLSQKLLAKKVEFTIAPEAAEYVRNAGITKEYGAREIDRVIAGEVKPLLAELLLFGRLKRGGKCTLVLEEGSLKVR
ncbi:MAG: AAA domain-containing protein [Lachnospiraceae bacterium]|nr:AAA domain-containing protein [Lachnospiraceae bacterium]MCI9658362.1 AAA domain-containing protein [Lachnospiraceae bacterium]